MKQDLENKKLTSYLLGEMSEAGQDRFEEQIFADEDLSLSLDAAENDLIDEYLRGELAAKEKQRFEQNFLVSGRRREKLELAKVLHSEVFDEKPVTAATASQTSLFEQIAEFFRLPKVALAGGLAAIVLFILFGGFWILRQTEEPQVANLDQENKAAPIKPTEQIKPPVNENLSNSQPETEPSPVEENINQANENKSEIKPKPTATPQKPETVQPQPRQVFAFTLFPPTRSSKVPQINIPENAKTIRLNVVNDQPQDFVRFRAEIRTAEGKVIWSREIPANSKTSRQTVGFSIETDKFTNGTYELALLGVTSEGQYEEVNFYNFKVQK